MPEQMLDGVTSDPVRMGWMQGFPPPPDKRIDPALGNHMRFPYTRWSFSHMREFLPTVRVSRGTGMPGELPNALRDDIDALRFTALEGEATTWAESLTANFTDAIVVLHRGRVAYERYFGVTRPDTRHIAFSVTKSFVGTLAEMLIAEGKLNPAAPVATYIPELANSGYAGASLRHVLDMTTGIDFSEDYADTGSGIADFSHALGLTPRPEGYSGPTDLYTYLPSLRPGGSHGQGFTYRTINTEVLGWIVARAEGKRFHEVLGERIWEPLGMQADADMLVDSAGVPFTGGGLNPTLRDMARFGETIRNDGRLGDTQVLPTPAIRAMKEGARGADAIRSPHQTIPGLVYRSQWWFFDHGEGPYSARGIHGQAIYIDPTAEMVIARFASHPTAANSVNDMTSLPAYRALAAYLSEA